MELFVALQLVTSVISWDPYEDQADAIRVHYGVIHRTALGLELRAVFREVGVKEVPPEETSAVVEMLLPDIPATFPCDDPDTPELDTDVTCTNPIILWFDVRAVRGGCESG